MRNSILTRWVSAFQCEKMLTPLVVVVMVVVVVRHVQQMWQCCSLCLQIQGDTVAGSAHRTPLAKGVEQRGSTCLTGDVQYDANVEIFTQDHAKITPKITPT